MTGALVQPMVSGGIEMLVYQGAEGFRLWTGRDAPVDVMREAVAPAAVQGVLDSKI